MLKKRNAHAQKKQNNDATEEDNSRKAKSKRTKFGCKTETEASDYAWEHLLHWMLYTSKTKIRKTIGEAGFYRNRRWKRRGFLPRIPEHRIWIEDHWGEDRRKRTVLQLANLV